MESNVLKSIVSANETAFIDKKISSNPFFKPQLISNDYTEGKKVLSTIIDELSNCEEFYISVAFITMGGIVPLLEVLKKLRNKGIKGKILTTDYLTFSDPKALSKLSEFENIELRMFLTDNDKEGFHTKGYIFKDSETYRIIIGSSNITQNALTINKEWNTRLVSNEQGEMAESVLIEFNKLWNSKNTRRFSEFIYDYELKYRTICDQKQIVAENKLSNLISYKLQPNSMQLTFISNFMDLYSKGENKALLISATGTGKTYASAFGLRSVGAKRVLFLVHREQIARNALKSYSNVFPDSINMGILSGNSKDFNSDFIFSTMQTMSMDNILEKFDKQAFDFIVVDEVHVAGAPSYQKIMNYFEPKMYLGMTASPDRMDDFDIYKLFDHNIVQEIRLQQALEEDLLCPFHYFGITDLFFEGEKNTNNLRDFRYLTDEKRIEYILKQIDYYSFSGDRVKGLIFCSSKAEAKFLSNAFNKRGLRTEALTGEDSLYFREKTIERLVSDGENCLDFILTVDIFNEGIDIPEVNQIVMLRPTESPIIFVQQLGRGLRKSKNKEFVVIIDFIGNYSNNYMVPIALYGDRTYNKDGLRRAVTEGSRILPGASTINFDEISKKRIFESIDIANFNDSKLIKENYKQLKYKLGRIPRLIDFIKYESIDPQRIFDSSRFGSYYNLIKIMEKEYSFIANSEQEEILKYISKKYASGKRIHELFILKNILNNIDNPFDRLRNYIVENTSMEYNNQVEENVVKNLTGKFMSGSGKDTFSNCLFIEKDENDYKISSKLKELIKDQEFKNLLEETIDLGLYRNRVEYNPTDLYQNTQFKLYAKYTYEEVCRHLNWDKAEVALNIGGYKYDEKTKTYPVFINYNKDEDIADTIKYEDMFLSENLIQAISKSGRNLQSNDVITALNSKDLGVDMELFVRKNKDDKISKEFYYLGRIHSNGYSKEFTMEGTTRTAVEFQYELDTPVREDIYEYITK